MTKIGPRKKILFLITKSNFGGAQRYVYDLATALPKEEFSIMVAFGGQGELKNKLEAANIAARGLGGLTRDFSWFKEIKASLAIFRLIRQERPDILHINSSKAGAIGAILGRLLGVPKIVFTAHGWAFNEDRSTISKFLIKVIHWLTVLFSHETIAVSYQLKSQMNWPLVARKITVIHNGRTVNKFLERNFARQKIVEFEPKLVPFLEDFWSVTIGELHPVKQHQVTIAAMEKVVELKPEARHIIIGAGELKEKLKKEIADRGLEKNVFLMGAIDEAAKYLKAFDLFVLSSRSEALAYVIIEAAAAGLPIIASRVGGIPEIIADRKNGLLFESGSVAALSSAYLELTNNPSLRENYARAAKERSQAFNFNQMLEQTTRLYLG